MRRVPGGLAVFLGGLVGLLLTPAPLPAQQRSWVNCESAGGYERCYASDSWRGARLVRQLSQAPCIEGRSWGFERDYIWVDRGCRGRFEAGDPYANQGERVTCASNAGSRERCPADTERGVRLVRQLSQTPCVEGRTWGMERNFIWVDGGCRGEFLVERGGGVGRQVTCESHEGAYAECDTPGGWRGIRLVRQLSSTPCVENRTWGFRARQIWVDDGCRGVFEPGTGGGSWDRVSCASSGRYQRCVAYTQRGVRLARLGEECVMGRSWGVERGYVWVSEGCRAEFVVGVR